MTKTEVRALHAAAPLLLALLLSACGTTPTATAKPATAEVPQGPYAEESAWLCKPGRNDLCAGGQDATVLAADGTATREAWRPNQAAPIDCFYVYPTISDAKTGNSTLAAGAGEQRAVQQQFARFASVCRPFAPMYRQVTLAGLVSAMSGNPLPIEPDLNYRDVAAAWQHYLRHENRGRGVVLVGHSQGARMLAQLIQREIEGKPVQAQLVSALLIGYNFEVPVGADVGGTLRQVPLCRSADQVGCVVGYVSFRGSAPPPANTRFGKAATPGMRVACTDPATLTRSPLRGYYDARANLLGAPLDQPEWAAARALPTRFVALPGLAQSRCVEREGVSYLAVDYGGTPQRRPADVPGDLYASASGQLMRDWGLHLVDVNLAQGNLLELVRSQGAAYLRRAR